MIIDSSIVIRDLGLHLCGFFVHRNPATQPRCLWPRDNLESYTATLLHVAFTRTRTPYFAHACIHQPPLRQPRRNAPPQSRRAPTSSRQQTARRGISTATASLRPRTSHTPRQDLWPLHHRSDHRGAVDWVSAVIGVGRAVFEFRGWGWG